MATFEAQVEGLTGLSIDGSSSPTQTELTQYLKDGVNEVTNRMILLRPQDKSMFTRKSAIQSSNSYDIGRTEVTGVMREATADGSSDGSTAWRSCRRVSPLLQSRVVDTESLEYASIYNPVYILDDSGKVSVYPVPDGTDDGFIVYYINNNAVNDSGVSLAYSHDAINYFPTDKIYLVVIYAGIKSLENALAAKTSDLPSNITSLSLEVPSESLPTYTAPDSFVMPVPPPGTDIDFSDIPEIKSFIPPVFSSDIPTYVSPSVTPDYDDANNWINVEEDEELLVARMQVINAQLSQYQAEIQDAVNTFNLENTKYKNDLAEYGANVQKESSRVSSSLADFQAEVNKAIQTYQAETGFDLNRYKSEFQGEVQKYQAALTKNSTTFDKDLAKYTADYTKASSINGNKLQKYQADIGNFSAKINKVKSDYEWMHQRLQKLQQQYDGAFGLMAPQQKQGDR